MKSLIKFHTAILEDLGELCGVSTNRDLKTITDRVEREGFSFLTITLPTLAKALERGLADGQFDRQLASAFSCGRGSLPLFMGGFFGQIFDKSTATLLPNPSVEAIIAIRQVGYLWKRVNLPCTDARVKASYERYVKCDEEVRSNSTRVSESFWDSYRDCAARLFGTMFASIDALLYNEGMVPSHGPGATADRLSANSRFNLPVWTERLESLFPSLEYCFPNYGWYQSSDYQVQELLPPELEPPVRVVSVPKTLKTPRIIAIEPAHMMYVQQGLLSVIRSAMRNNTNAFHTVCFDSQEENQRLAREGSNGSLATLDLQEASDRVSTRHVEELLAYAPTLREGVMACRSTKADVPGEGLITLAKFASMGSALCFPMEAMVFCTVVFLGIARSRNVTVTQRLINELRGQVRIYGDDIIVPTRDAESVYSMLEAFGFKVNADKSFWTGRFRESCGKDYYASRDVSIHKLKHVLPSTQSDVEGIASAVSFRNRLNSETWYTRTVEFLDKELGKLIPMPYVLEGSAILGKVDPILACGERMDKDLQVPLVRGARISSISPSDPLDGNGALMKFFLKQGVEPYQDEFHLLRAGRPRSAKITFGWGRL